jgi:hypothetical protein
VGWRRPVLGSPTGRIAKYHRRQAASDLTAFKAVRDRGSYPGPLLIGDRKAGMCNVVLIESIEIVLFSVALIVFVVVAIMMLRSR